MNTFYFGSSDQPLYGAYFPPVPGTSGKRGVVICQPLWQEYVRARWACNQLAHNLSSRGIHVLLFDYFGTGDSSGDTGEGRTKRWIDDTVCAIRELQDMSGIKQYGLVGVRFGAAIVCGVCAEKGITPFATGYWDPVFDGASYLDEIVEFQTRLGVIDDKIVPSTGDGLTGFFVPPAQRHDIKQYCPVRPGSFSQAPWFVAYSQKTPSCASVLENPDKGRFYKGEYSVPREGGWCTKETYDKILMPHVIPDKLGSFFSLVEP
jgi:pimeloyl-ACP methyl ester carboxylesterase